MLGRDRPIKLEVAPPHLEVWERDAQHPALYHFGNETLRRSADNSPGLTVVRLTPSRNTLPGPTYPQTV